MPLTNHDILLITVPNTGTRSVIFYYRGLGKVVRNIHFIPDSSKLIDKFPRQITTLRNPYNVAASWMNHKQQAGTFFNIFDWEEHWTLWHKAVTEHSFEVIVIENFKEQIHGYNPDRKPVEIPIDKVQFAMDLIADTGIEHPHYGANS